MYRKNHNKMKLRFSLIFIVAVLFSNAQISGYMGKRCVISYSNYFMIGFKGPGPFNSAPADESSPTLNNANCLNFEYAYKQNKMVCISGQYIGTGIAYNDGKTNGSFVGDLFTSTSDYPYPYNHKYVGDYSKPASLRSINFSIGLKTFKRGFIAPVGRYRKMEVLIMFEKLKYDHAHFAQQDPNSSDPQNYIISDFGTGQYSFKNIAFAYTMGKQRILYDKIVLDYGIRFAYSPALNIITLAAGDEYATSTDSYFRRTCNLRMATEQLINFHLGIGFLAF